MLYFVKMFFIYIYIINSFYLYIRAAYLHPELCYFIITDMSCHVSLSLKSHMNFPMQLYN